jgi:DNA-binding beta-propeller fold protein YncE
VLATEGSAPGQVHNPRALAVDAAGNLYVAQASDQDAPSIDRIQIQRRDTRGYWSVIATYDPEADGSFVPGQVVDPQGLAVDAAGNLYVSDKGGFYQDPTANRVQKRDVQGHWTFTNDDAAVGQFSYPGDLAVDGAGHLYVADNGNSRVLEYTPDGSP